MNEEDLDIESEHLECEESEDIEKKNGEEKEVEQEV